MNQVKNAQINIKIPVDNEGCFDIEKQKELSLKYENIEEQKSILLRKVKFLKEISVQIESNSNMKIVSMDKLFASIERGKSKYTKTFCRDNPGEYPVYSADNEKPLGHMNQYDYDGEYLTISINGIAGKTRIFNERFSVNADRVVCQPQKDVDILYVKYASEPGLRNSIKGRVGELGKNEFSKLTPDMIRKLEISIPVTADGEYDFQTQRQMAEKYRQIEEIKENLYNKLMKLLNVVIE